MSYCVAPLLAIQLQNAVPNTFLVFVLSVWPWFFCFQQPLLHLHLISVLAENIDSNYRNTSYIDHENINQFISKSHGILAKYQLIFISILSETLHSLRLYWKQFVFHIFIPDTFFSFGSRCGSFLCFVVAFGQVSVLFFALLSSWGRVTTARQVRGRFAVH